MRCLLIIFLTLIYFNATSQTLSFTYIGLKAINLSEDMSRISSKNDEVILFVYTEHPDSCKPAPFMINAFVMDSSHNNWSADIDEIPGEGYPASHIWIVLIEQDTQQDIVQIEAVFRLYKEDILQAYKKDDLKTIMKYLGDNDILYIKKFWREDLYNYKETIRGIHSMDQYEYELTIQQ